jgi:rhodanese-related sulfurtransferase
MPIQQLQPRELRDWLDDGGRPAPVLLDVREPWEVEVCRIDGSLSIPMNNVAERFSGLDPDAEMVLICHHGGRSMQVALFLERGGFTKLHNLSGGVDAWARLIDPAMAVY